MRVLDGHTDVNLACGNQVDHHTEPVKRPENSGQEPMRDAFPVRMYVQDDDALLDRNGRGELFVAPVNQL